MQKPFWQKMSVFFLVQPSVAPFPLLSGSARARVPGHANLSPGVVEQTFPMHSCARHFAQRLKWIYNVKVHQCKIHTWLLTTGLLLEVLDHPG